MNKKIYEDMQNLYKQKGDDLTQKNDVKYIGTMVYDESTPTGIVKTAHDVYVISFKDTDGNVTETYFNENGKCLAGRSKDGVLHPVSDFLEYDSSFLKQLNTLGNNQGLTIEDYERNIDEISKKTNIPKEQIKSTSEIDLDQEVENEEDENKITLNSDENKEEDKEQIEENEKKLDKIDSKEEIDMDKLIDDRYSLADIMGAKPGSKLIAVFSDTIKDNNNSTKFSFIIQNPDGSLSPADMLEQTGGTHSDKTVYETNRDGSKVEEVDVTSSYKIDSPIRKNCILNVRYGSMGYIEANYGEIDPTNHKSAFTQKLETDRDYYTTKEVRDEFSNKRDGERNIKNDIEEIEMHKKADCDDLTLDEADGHLETGHVHNDAIMEIKAYDPNIELVFTDNEIQERLNKMMDNNPEKSFEEVLENTACDLSEDAYHMRSREEHQ